jgi:hypothetical protein
MKRRRKQPAEAPKDWRIMLKARLVPNQAVLVEQDSVTRDVHVKVPTKRPGYLVPPISWVVRPPEFRTLVLDPVGAAVWSLCDETKTVEEIIDSFAVEYGLTFHEARVSVTNYAMQLLQRGALAVVMPEKGGGRR